jgi:Domain of Unknown Function (DUF1080)
MARSEGTKDRMFRLLALAVLLVLGLTAEMAAASEKLTASTSAASLPKPDAGGFITLFNGRDLAGWKGLPEYWSVIEGAISGHATKETSKQTFLVFADLNVKDFELHLKYRFASPAGNSGIQFRSTVLDSATFRVGGYQADFDVDMNFDGSIYDEAGAAGGRSTMSNRGEKTIWNTENERQSEPLKERGSELKRLIRRGGWNDVVLVAKGPHILYSINGHVMTELIDHSAAALRQGVLALQLHEGYTMDVRFKDVRFKILNE